MRLRLAVATATGLVVAWALPTGPAGAAGLSEFALVQSVSDQRKNKTPRRTGRQTDGQGQRQIACTQYGCGPIPPGCEIRTGFIPFTWDPSGYDEVVCPYRPHR